MAEQGTVVRSTGSAYTVRTDDGRTVECRLKGRMRLGGSRSTNPVAVGDRVTFAVEGGAGVISEVRDRRNYIVRRSTNLSKESHVIAANVDQALLVTTIRHPETTTTFIDRFLASAEAYGVPAIVAFNKTDLCGADDMEELEYREAVYGGMGYPTLRLSSVSGEGVEALREALRGKLTAIAGHSGVGKSTLINTLEPGLDIRTSTISDANDSGRHTTTFAEMHTLSFGGDIIDTPGIRGFGVINIDRGEAGHYFRDIFKVSRGCRFPNCTHTHEPACAVRDAVESGDIAPTRYASYLNIVAGEDDKYREGGKPRR